MSDIKDRSSQIKTAFPHGLTGVVVIAGTRTTYILENNQHSEDPGKIDNFWTYAHFLEERYVQFIKMFFDTGLQNMIIPMYSYQGFYERGEEYTKLAMQTSLLLIGDPFVKLYQEHNIDPYFVGLDTIKHLPDGHPAHHLKSELERFSDTWDYQADNKKLIWEVAPIPLYSYWQDETSSALNTKINQTHDLRELHDMVYSHYSTSVYGFDLPQPDFYIGSNRNGDIKLRAMYPISMLCGSPCRFYFLPYPSLYLTEKTLHNILGDLINGNPLQSVKKDYSGQITQSILKAEQDRILKLSKNPDTVVGLTRETP